MGSIQVPTAPYEIRRLDMIALDSPSLQTQLEFCQDLVDCFSAQGMIKLVNHGIPESMVEQAFSWNQRFFELPAEIKRKIAHPPRANPNRGWVEIGLEKSSAIKDFEKGFINDAPAIFDVKESFDQGAQNDPLYKNVWPDQDAIPGFKEFMEPYYDACQAVHMNILHALNRGFQTRGIDVDLVEKCKDNVSEIRLNYYPAVNIKDIKSGKLNRISEHTDFGTVTLLLQDSVGGLEVENQSQMGTYIPVEASNKSEMLVNVGDSLQRLTNDVLTSVSHRVTIPRSMQHEQEGEASKRYSIAYFAKVSRHQSLKPLDQFVSVINPPKYEDITAYELNQIKLHRIYG